jgi:hypothetical protein
LTFGVLEQMAGRRAPIGRCLLVGLRTMFPALLYLIVVALGAFAFSFAGGLGLLVLTAITPVLGVLGIIGMVVLFLMFFVALYVAVPALAIERNGVFDSIGRSQDLTRHRRWQVFAVWLVTFLAGIAFAFLIGYVFAMSDAVAATWRVMIGLQLVAQTVMAVLSSTVTAVVYVLLRKDADGTDVGELAKVFD